MTRKQASRFLYSGHLKLAYIEMLSLSLATEFWRSMKQKLLTVIFFLNDWTLRRYLANSLGLTVTSNFYTLKVLQELFGISES